MYPSMTRPKPKGEGERELRAKIFRTGRSQAVRLPKEVRFEEDQGELRVRREGRRVILEPLDEWFYVGSDSVTVTYRNHRHQNAAETFVFDGAGLVRESVAAYEPPR
jgi:virulence-associated protein VagC